MIVFEIITEMYKKIKKPIDNFHCLQYKYFMFNRISRLGATNDFDVFHICQASDLKIYSTVLGAAARNIIMRVPITFPVERVVNVNSTDRFNYTYIPLSTV